VPPFHFDATVHKPSHFPSSDNHHEPGKYWQSVRFLDRHLGVKLENRGQTDSPEIKLSVYSNEPLRSGEVDRVASELDYRFDLHTDLSSFYAELGDDPLLGPVFARWRGMRVKACQSLYEFLVIATVLQNATVRRSVQMMENLFHQYGTRIRFDGRELACFWDPEALAAVEEAELRALKVGYRARALSLICRAFASHELDEMQMRTMPADELRKRLLGLYGVGPASVWYIMFEVFHHYDEVETVSPWEQKIYSRLLFGQESVSREDIVAEVTRRWGRWRMLALHYLFEDIFWKRKTQTVDWLEPLIRL